MFFFFFYKDYEAFPYNAGFEEETVDAGKNVNFEKYPTGLKAGIKIQNLRKLFSTPQGLFKFSLCNVVLHKFLDYFKTSVVMALITMDSSIQVCKTGFFIKEN